MIKIELNYSLRAHLFEPMTRTFATDRYARTYGFFGGDRAVLLGAGRGGAAGGRGAGRPAPDGNAFPRPEGPGHSGALDAMTEFLPGPAASGDELCGVAFAVARDKVLGRGVWVRLFGGKLENRTPLDIRTGTDPVTGEPVFVQRKISQIRSAGAAGQRGQLRFGRAGKGYHAPLPAPGGAGAAQGAEPGAAGEA